MSVKFDYASVAHRFSAKFPIAPNVSTEVHFLGRCKYLGMILLKGKPVSVGTASIEQPTIYDLN
jgi:hypothetical protein